MRLVLFIMHLCAWCVTASNIVFVDSPAGVGYSYSNTSSDYNYLDDDLTGTCALHRFISEFFIECNELTTSLHQQSVSSFSHSGILMSQVVCCWLHAAVDALAFMVGSFTKFPEYLKNDVYVLGESYAGHYAPNLAQKILLHNEEAPERSNINLKGFMVCGMQH
jgi:carboxypeptidase C (cathepsin A)